jgi:uncharacterized membrane protein
MEIKNWKDRLWEIIFLLFMMYLVLCVIGCVSDGKLLFKSEQELIQSKLNRVIQLDGQLGAVLGYNTKRFNGPEFNSERLFQQFNGIPQTQVQVQQFKKIRGKYGL